MDMLLNYSKFSAGTERGCAKDFIACSQTSWGFHTTGHIPCWHQWYVTEWLNAIGDTPTFSSEKKKTSWLGRCVIGHQNLNFFLLTLCVCATTWQSERCCFTVVSRRSCTCQSGQQAQLPRTCRPDCIPNPCGQIDSEALLTFHIPWADLVIWHFVWAPAASVQTPSCPL